MTSERPIYHVYNRGVEKRDIFLEERDYLRFLNNLEEFNTKEPALNVGRNIKRRDNEVIDIRSQSPLVRVFLFTLMPNHFHMVLQEVEDDGIPKFMQKLGIGYTKYFNIKYKRVGPLFQGGYQSVLLESDAHFLYLPHYLHLNPLDLKYPKWREGKVKNPSAALAWLEKYRWSSHLDYLGKENFPTIIEKELFSSLYKTPQKYRQSLIDWIERGSMLEVAGAAIEDTNQID